MIRGLVIRPATQDDRDGIREIETGAFGRPDEADLVEALLADGDVVLELVATHEMAIVGHILFSRLFVDQDGNRTPAVALAPLAIQPQRQKTKVGSTLIENAHVLLKDAGEILSVVLGDPAYYGRFGYARDRAAGFDSDYQGDALQALAFGDAPTAGRLVYPRAFTDL